MTEIMTYMNFTLNFLRPNKNYGLYNETERKWNGILGNLSRGDINMSFTDTAVSMERSLDFDFTIQLYTTYNALFIRTPERYTFKWNAYLKVTN